MSYIVVKVVRTQIVRLCLKIQEDVDVQKYIESLQKDKNGQVFYDALQHIEEEYIKEHGFKEYRNSFFDIEEISCSGKSIKEVTPECSEDFLVYKVKEEISCSGKSIKEVTPECSEDFLVYKVKDK